jgi:alpha-tubulin suppressor-like RCC1 family protein
MMMKDKLFKLTVGISMTLSLALSSCGGRDGASPALPLLVAGDAHTVAIKKDGTLWAWGQNDSGELGNGTDENSNTPIQIGKSTEWRSVSAGGQHTAAIKKDGTLWAWGLNQDGQLGNGTNTNSQTPVQIGH